MSAFLSTELVQLVGENKLTSPGCSASSPDVSEPMIMSLISQKEACMGCDVSKVTAQMTGRNGRGNSEFPNPDLYVSPGTLGTLGVF